MLSTVKKNYRSRYLLPLQSNPQTSTTAAAIVAAAAAAVSTDASSDNNDSSSDGDADSFVVDDDGQHPAPEEFQPQKDDRGKLFAI